jgi:hypothetical protein
MTKFKVGDIVRRTAMDRLDVKVGDVGVVVDTGIAFIIVRLFNGNIVEMSTDVFVEKLND